MKKLMWMVCGLVCALKLWASEPVVVGADQLERYLPLIKNKSVGIVTNQSGMVGQLHIVDFLTKIGTRIACVFAPEHGFRGYRDAGAKIYTTTDKQTGLPIRSLFNGDVSKPTAEALADIDIVVFDLQDVGVRYYSYLTTLFRVMEACAENNKPLLILDRPNPNGFYVDGPILDMRYKSMWGILPIPIIHGMTLGELATMINGEHWLANNLQCNLTVITCKNYTHQTKYVVPVPPSPNLPTMRSVYLYPSLVYFEATPISIGRGTEFPFQVYGHPNMLGCTFSFNPESVRGAKNPPLRNFQCQGRDLRTLPSDSALFAEGIDLRYLIDAYWNMHLGSFFFNSFFETLIGVDYVKPMIINGRSAAEIERRWLPDVEKFKQQRKPYLLYPE